MKSYDRPLVSSRKPHPSGRPVRKEEKPRPLQYLRIPQEGYVIPRLQPKERSLDIGFYQAFREIED